MEASIEQVNPYVETLTELALRQDLLEIAYSGLAKLRAAGLPPLTSSPTVLERQTEAVIDQPAEVVPLPIVRKPEEPAHEGLVQADVPEAHEELVVTDQGTEVSSDDELEEVQAKPAPKEIDEAAWDDPELLEATEEVDEGDGFEPPKAIVQRREPGERRVIQNMPHGLLDRPFVNVERAKELVPEVFEHIYDGGSGGNNAEGERDLGDRLVLRAMIKHYCDASNGSKTYDPSIKQRLFRNYGSQELQLGYERGVTSDGAYDLSQLAGRFRMLKGLEEETALAQKMKTGVAAYKVLSEAGGEHEHKTILEGLAREGAYAYQAFYHSNMRLALHEARRYKGFGLDDLDLIQHAFTGLQAAIEKFDERKGFKFSTYAVTWIRQAVQRGLENEARIIRLPVHAAQRARRLDRDERIMTSELHREPTQEELAERTGIAVDEIDLLQKRGGTKMASLNAKVGSEGDTEFGDLIASQMGREESYAQADDKSAMTELFKEAGLTGKEILVLALRYGVRLPELEDTEVACASGMLPYAYVFDNAAGENGEVTLKSIGEVLGVKHQAVGQIEQRALHKLRMKRHLLER